MAAKKQVQLELNLNSKDLQRDLKKAAKEVGELEEGFEDTESAGKAMAKVITKSADDMIDEIKKTEKAVEELERALGPDFDGDTREVVADLKRLGLTAQDIEQDAEELAAAIKAIDNVNVKATEAGFKDLNQAIGGAADETGRAADVTHGYVGSALSEIPGVTETFGPLSEGISQVTEGLLAGEIKFQDLGRMVGPMAGVTGGVLLLSKALGSVAETKAFNKEQIESFKDARDAVADLNEETTAFSYWLKEQEAIKARSGGFVGFFEGTEDILPIIMDANIGYEELVAGMEKGGNTYDAVRQKLADYYDEQMRVNEATMVSTDAYYANIDVEGKKKDSLEALDQVQKNYAKSQTDSARVDAWIAEGEARAAKATKDYTKWKHYSADANDELSESARKAAKSANKTLHAEDELHRARRKYADDQERANRANTYAAHAYDELSESARNAGRESRYAANANDELSQKQRDAAESAEDLRIQQGRSREAMDYSANAADELSEKHRNLNQESRYTAEAEKELEGALNQTNEELLANEEALRSVEEATEDASSDVKTLKTDFENLHNVLNDRNVYLRIEGSIDDVITKIQKGEEVSEEEFNNMKLDALAYADTLTDTTMKDYIYTTVADTDQTMADIQALDWALAFAERDRNIIVNIRTRILDALGGRAFNYEGDPRNLEDDWPHGARGIGYSLGGTTLVGEEGPELVNLPRGATVNPNDRSRKMLRNANGGRPVVNNFYFPAGSTPKDVKAAQRRYDRVQGPR